MKPNSSSNIEIRYWGTRGTFTNALHPSTVTDKVVHSIKALIESGEMSELLTDPSADNIRACLAQSLPWQVRSSYGMHTTCIEVQTPDALLIIDAGSGMRQMEQYLSDEWNDLTADRSVNLLLSHGHWDHISSIPFTTLLRDPQNKVALWADESVLHKLDMLLGPDSPIAQFYFPVAYTELTGISGCHALLPDNTYSFGATEVQTYALCHPGGAMAYRISYGGSTFVVCTDHEAEKAHDEGLAEFMRGSQLAYVDAQYLFSEYDGREGIAGSPPLSRRGWGHSPIEYVIETTLAAEVPELHLGHQEPLRTDDELAELEKFAQDYCRQLLLAADAAPNACQVSLAREGRKIEL